MAIYANDLEISDRFPPFTPTPTCSKPNTITVPGYHIYESPVQVADDGSIWPGVCEYELSEDGLQLTLTVRENVKFHNGDTVDINDVVASIDRFLVYSSTGQANFGDYITDTQVNGSSVVYSFSAVAPIALLSIGELKGGCKVMPAEIAQAHMDSYITDDAEIVGTGPYKLDTCHPNLHQLPA